MHPDISELRLVYVSEKVVERVKEIVGRIVGSVVIRDI